MHGFELPDARAIATAFALMVAMALAGWTGRREWSGALILALLSFAWFTVDHDWEFAVLVGLGKTHGIVITDVVGIVGSLVAAYEAVMLYRKRNAV